MKGLLCVVMPSLMLLCGCESKTAGGAALGGILGAGIGGIAGGGSGALIGGATGAIAGGLLGAVLDEEDRGNLRRESPDTYRRLSEGDRLSVGDIVYLHKARVSDRKIIDLIRRTDSRFHLTYGEINRLEHAGVSGRVIDYMLHRT